MIEVEEEILSNPEHHKPVFFKPDSSYSCPLCRQNVDTSDYKFYIDESVGFVLYKGKSVRLTKVEVTILALLYTKVGRVLTKEEIFNEIYWKKLQMKKLLTLKL